jgi:hypothetical protein
LRVPSYKSKSPHTPFKCSSRPSNGRSLDQRLTGLVLCSALIATSWNLQSLKSKRNNLGNCTSRPSSRTEHASSNHILLNIYNEHGIFTRAISAGRASCLCKCAYAQPSIQPDASIETTYARTTGPTFGSIGLVGSGNSTDGARTTSSIMYRKRMEIRVGAFRY